MSAKPATIYLGTRSHFRRRLKGQDGRYRDLLKLSASSEARKASTIRRFHHSSNHQSVLKKTNTVKTLSGKNNLAKNLSGSSTPKMTTSVLHLPTDLQNTSTTATVNNATKTANSPTANVKQGLPSPSSTSSETSDYQRSTPSPTSAENDILGPSEIDWSQSPHHHSHEEDNKPSRRKSTSNLVNNKISSNLVLHQLRVALKKLPEAKVTSLKPNKEAVKRRHSDCGLALSPLEALECKKAKISHKRPLSASYHKGQGKITEYLPEMKHFIAMRKEKLDRVLNLSTPSKDLLEPASTAEHQLTQQLTATASTADISKKEQAESGIESGSNNDTASVASSGSSRHSTTSSGIGSRREQDQDVFEVPRTIRFPPAAPSKCYSEVVICKWELCGSEFDSTGKLLDHLKSIHAVADNLETEDNEHHSHKEGSSVQYKCLWEGCKVYGKGSSSKSWLEKHVLSHGGNKPFQCIVDGCKHRFGTQTLLERHVNNHFKNKESTSGAVSNSSQAESSGISSSKSGVLSSASRSSASNQSTGSNSKVFRKLVGKRIKYRKTPFSARIFDLFDIGSMAQLKLKLSQYEKECQEWKNLGYLETPQLHPDQVVKLHSRIIARKTDFDGSIKVLQSWSPPNILEDEWISAKDIVPTKSVKLSSLPFSARAQLTSQLCSSSQPSNNKRRSRKTKPQPRCKALS